MKKAMFFDLQGTLGGEFLGDIRDFDFYPFAMEALKLAKSNGYLVFILTNQSRIAKGYFTLEIYKEHELRLLDLMKSNGVDVDGFYFCPHDKGQCMCKKPKDGMVKMAMENHEIDLARSYVVGDLGLSDMSLSKRIGSKILLVLTGGGKSSLSEFKYLWPDVNPTMIAENVLVGVKRILGEEI
ncbi:HAD-IIIA family hydrolase [Acidaminobacter sp. JC074]|uniref:D-glycero-alpha-D-manno-heptose-1,7-bisphosphate 7-phosphatase n=1 Tax=Acidaminobacter sp. JC074 TaxID=2530199 RepID=UPI001F0FC4A2|nr:HAD-IIIA family hydrolase [Acidaminobacter sp. JC074]MCH4889567.1 HAD-IIIA family hydrolase [Acidaminobacter sp. JC074]